MEERDSRSITSGLALQGLLTSLDNRRKKGFFSSLRTRNKPPCDVSTADTVDPVKSGERSRVADDGKDERSSGSSSRSWRSKFEELAQAGVLKEKLLEAPVKRIKQFLNEDVDMDDNEDAVGRDKKEFLLKRQSTYKKIAEFYKEKIINEYENFEEYLVRGDETDDKCPKIILQQYDDDIDQSDGGIGVVVVDNENIRRKSPITVQEWVDQLPCKPKEDKDGDESSGSKESDHLALGAEALDLKRSLAAAARLSREASVQSSSSLDSLLDARRPDPVEVLLNLGFGGVPGVDLDNCRIPKRFLVPSQCKGGDWNEFLKRELMQVQNFECSSLGFRGLWGPSHQRPSAIVANIMEKLRERTVPSHNNNNNNSHNSHKSNPNTKVKFSSVAKRVLNETSVLNKLSKESSSVLSPDNRKFLDNQGKISPEIPRRKIIFGQKSFAFSNDGELVEVIEPGDVDDESNTKHLDHKDSTLSLCSSSSCESDSDYTRSTSYSLGLSSENSRHQPTAEELLKLRRSSLQRQSKVDMDDGEFRHEFVDCKCRHDCLCRERMLDRQQSSQNVVIPKRFLNSVTTTDNIRDELRLEIEALSNKIQSADSSELSSILKQIQELKSRLH